MTNLVYNLRYEGEIQDDDTDNDYFIGQLTTVGRQERFQGELMVYLNNAATSFPKPDSVITSMTQNLRQQPQEPGRGNATIHADVLSKCRAALAELFHIKNPARIILTSGSTLALNYVIHGFMTTVQARHCLTSKLEHNSVLRPLNYWAQKGKLSIRYLSLPDIFIPENFKKYLLKNIDFVILNHASNVTGTILPVYQIAELCARDKIPLIIDASQSAGCVEIDISRLPGNVILVFTGHKGLMGPAGTGGFYLGEEIDLFESIIQGGTGIRSDLLFQPTDLPTCYEAGTPNLPGMTGLLAGVEYVHQIGVSRIGAHKARLMQLLESGIDSKSQVMIQAPENHDFRAGILSFTIQDWIPDDIGLALDQSFNISSRTGLHCAPLIHQEIGTWPRGSVRLSNSWFTTTQEIEFAAQAINTIARSAG